jgi:hypothetical protein
LHDTAVIGSIHGFKSINWIVCREQEAIQEKRGKRTHSSGVTLQMRLYQIGIIALIIRHYRTNERKGTSDYNNKRCNVAIESLDKQPF